MYAEKHYEGMFCSRAYAEWLLRKNEELDIPATSYYKLIRLFSRSNYREFFQEEQRKGNALYYDLVEQDDLIRLNRSYEIVFLPYEGLSRKEAEDNLSKITAPQWIHL